MADQNRSHAVMAQRYEAKDSLDDFPTPPWAVRALIEQHLGQENDTRSQTCLEPACGRGHMAATLREYFKEVDASDIHDYGHGRVEDFIKPSDAVSIDRRQYDWVITNPPFRLAEDFFFQAQNLARVGVALLVRTVFIESVGRFERVFSQYPPHFVAQFCERVAMVKGRVDPKASTATGYAWIVWTKDANRSCELRWIKPCRKQLENANDYDPKFISKAASPIIDRPPHEPFGDLFGRVRK